MLTLSSPTFSSFLLIPSSHPFFSSPLVTSCHSVLPIRIIDEKYCQNFTTLHSLSQTQRQKHSQFFSSGSNHRTTQVIIINHNQTHKKTADDHHTLDTPPTHLRQVPIYLQALITHKSTVYCNILPYSSITLLQHTIHNLKPIFSTDLSVGMEVCLKPYVLLDQAFLCG